MGPPRDSGHEKTNWLWASAITEGVQFLFLINLVFHF